MNKSLRLPQLSKLSRLSGFKKAAIVGTLGGVVVGIFSYSPAKVLTALSSMQGLKIYKKIPYGTHQRQFLDVYQPTNLPADLTIYAENGLPVVVFIHGGSWQHGEKEGHGFIGRSLAQAGFLTVVIDYRLAPKNIYPDFINDSVSAIAWVYQRIAEYGGDPNKLFIMGHSAGAFNAVVAVDDARFWRNSHVPNDAIKAVIGLAGPYSFDYRQYQSKVAFPAHLHPEGVMPDRHVRPDAPPHYLMVAENDNLVGIKNMLKMKRALERAKVPVKSVVIPKVNHMTMIVAMAKPTRWLGKTRDLVLDYIAERLEADALEQKKTA